MPNTITDPYKGQSILLYDGPRVVLSSQESEPDGYGGRFVDVTIKKGNFSALIPNLSTTDIEDMLVTLRDAFDACPRDESEGPFREFHKVRRSYRCNGNWDVYLDGTYFGTHWTG